MTFVAPNLACGEARGGRIPCHGAVTDEQRSHRPNSAQPGGRQVFSPRLRCSLLTDPLRDMLVAHASSGRKIPCRERHRIYASDQLTGPFGSNVIVENSTNLQSWIPIQTNTVPPDGLNLSVPVGTKQKQFLRARLLP